MGNFELTRGKVGGEGGLGTSMEPIKKDSEIQQDHRITLDHEQ